jgi:trimeric autotransporter adhesin
MNTMRRLQILWIFSITITINCNLYSQVGNYVKRDSTTTTPLINYNFVLGPKAAVNLDNATNRPSYSDESLRNTAIGSYSAFNLSKTGSGASYNRFALDNTYIGAFSGYSLLAGVINGNVAEHDTYIGSRAGYSIQNGDRNTLIGSNVASMSNNITETVMIGFEAGKYSNNIYGKTVYIGAGAGYKTTAFSESNTFIGYKAGSGDDATALNGNENVYIGAFTGQFSSTGTFYPPSSGHNTFIGFQAGQNNKSDNNTFIGHKAGVNTQQASNNTFIGSSSGLQNNTGTFNTFIGFEAGKTNTSGQNNTYIGHQAGSNASNATITNAVAIGYNAQVTQNNAVVLGEATNQNMAVGIGNTAPQNRLEITSATTNTSGLRFTNLKSTSTPSTSNNLGLSVNANGDVILVPAGGGGSVTPDSMIVKYIGATKFVGLGIATPTEKLHISGGNLRVENTLPRIYMKNTSTGTDNTLAQLGSDNIVKLANSAIYVEAFGGLPSIYIKNNAGNIGIGNTNPTNKLEITSASTNTSGLRFTNLKSTSTPSTANSLALSVDANGDVILVPAATGGLTNPVTNLQVLSGTAGVSGLRLNNLPNTSATVAANGKALSVDATGNVILVPVTTPVIPAGADVWDQLTNGADYLIRNKNNKSVMIGTVAATKTSIDYKLYVEKGILAEKVKVSVQANWPDYVFGKDYSLMPLKEVENYISTNNHLPEVPSAEVIAKDGLDLGKMDATLLKKVEELTLYLIEQNKKIEVLQNELNTLKAKK